jgi:hypothetical protein
MKCNRFRAVEYIIKDGREELTNNCGHLHKTPEAAQKCADKMQRKSSNSWNVLESVWHDDEEGGGYS